MRKLTLVVLLFSLLTILSARSKRVNQIPHGSVFSCQTCHTGQGGPRNSFGSQIGSNYLDGNGDVEWGSDLAALDADEDGATNGYELQDPNGTWVQGNDDPGNSENVTNPGDPASVSIDPNKKLLLNQFELLPNYPNPFNISTRLGFIIHEKSSLQLKIYDVQGKIIKVLTNSVFTPGTYEMKWDGKDDFGNIQNTGIYIAKLTANNQVSAIKMLLIK